MAAPPAPEPGPGAPAGGEPAATGNRRLGHLVGFDGLRGVALIIVVVAHMSVLIPAGRFLLLPGGTVGLDAFFVLSGFLITVLLLKEQKGTGRIKLGSFYRRRALRLLPALIALLVVHAVYAHFTHLSASVERASLLSVLFYFSNYYLALGHPQQLLGGAPFADGLRHLWSLSVEEQFYLIWPMVVILFLGIRRSLKVVVPVLLGAIAFISVYRFIGYHRPSDYYGLFVRTDYRADAMLWGALIAHLWVRRREPRRWVHLAAWPATIFLIYVVLFVNEIGPVFYRGGLTAIDFSCAVLVLAILDGRWAGVKVLDWKPFVLLGTVSYGFYLWHFFIFSVVARYGKTWGSPLRVTVALAVTTAFTLASWFLLERPALRRKTKFEPSTTESSTAAARPHAEPRPPSTGAPTAIEPRPAELRQIEPHKNGSVRPPPSATRPSEGPAKFPWET